MLARKGRKGSFRYLDAKGREVRNEETLERIARLAIPPAWRNVEIAVGPRTKIQATGLDAAGRKQYVYNANFRAAQERAKFERLIRFGERLPALRTVMAEHLDMETLERDRVTAIALRLIDLGWFRVGNDRHTQTSGTYGITTLRKRHINVRGARVRLSFVGKGRAAVRSSLVDDELAVAVRELLVVPGGARLFRYEREDADLCNLTSRVVNEYVKTYLGEEFTAKDFRTWGGTLLAAIAFAERTSNGKGAITAVMRSVSGRLGNTPAVCRQSYVAPAVVDAYLEGRTLADFRPRHLRKLGARQTGLDPEEVALIRLLNFR